MYIHFKKVHTCICVHVEEIEPVWQEISQIPQRNYVNNFLANFKQDCSPEAFALGWTLTIFSLEAPAAFQFSSPSCYRIWSLIGDFQVASYNDYNFQNQPSLIVFHMQSNFLLPKWRYIHTNIQLIYKDIRSILNNTTYFGIKDSGACPLSTEGVNWASKP